MLQGRALGKSGICCEGAAPRLIKFSGERLLVIASMDVVALLFALVSLLNRAVTRGIDPVQSALWQNLTIALVLLPFAGPAVTSVPPRDWLWIALLGVLCTGLAHSLFVASLKVLKARTTSVIFALEPVYGIAIAWWLFAEQPSLRMLAGGALIIVASIVTSRLKSSSPPEPGVA